jgi:predicted metalloprotease with PDZ domain
MTAAHEYRIVARDPAAHLFEVTVEIAAPDPAGQAVRFPAWIPGSYMIRDLARHVVSISATSEGREIDLTKLDKSTWQAEPCSAPLTVRAEIYAFDLNVRGAYLDTEHGFFDGACVFPEVVGQGAAECRLEIAPPKLPAAKHWRVATSMRTAGAAPYEFGKYAAADYAELIDHPVEMGGFQIGEFEALGIPHAIAVQGEAHFDMGRLCHDLATLCETQLGFLGKPDNLDRYLFLVTVRESGYGGLEHRWSSALICSRADLPRRGQAGTSDEYRKFLGLCSHEYFHLWNVKRMKPARFTPYRLEDEVHTGLLWVFEGITSYYDDLFLARSGLLTPESYLELLGMGITRVLRTPGRFRQDIESSSFDAWTKLYKQDANAPNSMISYYAKGALVAFALDLTIRKDTHGKYSLDDVMRACWSRYGETGEGMPERGLESVARSVSGLELEDFFERFVRGTVDPPLGALLRTVGISSRLRPADGATDTGGKPGKDDLSPPPWLGARLAENGGSSRFAAVYSSGPAERAGIAPGDEAVALDGLRLSAGNLDRRLRDHHPGDTVSITVFRDDVLVRRRITLGEPPEDTCFLEVDTDADESAVRQREDWLGSAALK